MNTWGSRRPTAWLRHSLSPYTYILLQPALFRAGLFFAFMPKQHLFHAAAFGGWLDIGWVRGRAFIRPGEGFAPGCPRRAAAVSQRGATPSFLERKKGGEKPSRGHPVTPIGGLFAPTFGSLRLVEKITVVIFSPGPVAVSPVHGLWIWAPFCRLLPPGVLLFFTCNAGALSPRATAVSLYFL